MALRRGAVLLLWAELVVMVAALVVTVAVLRSGSMAVATPNFFYGAVLIVAGTMGLVALRRESAILYLRTSIVLFAPVVLAVASALSGSPEEVEWDMQWFDATELRRALELLTWAQGLAFAAVVLAALAGVLMLLLRSRVVARRS